MLKAGSACFAYETLEVDGKLPLLVPMSEVAGRMAIQVGAFCLEKAHGGRGVLLGGVPGSSRATCRARRRHRRHARGEDWPRGSAPT